MNTILETSILIQMAALSKRVTELTIIAWGKRTQVNGKMIKSMTKVKKLLVIE